MSQDEIRQLIEEVAQEIVLKLRKVGLIDEHKLSSYRKTEDLLRNYKKLKNSDMETTQKLIHILEDELKALSDDPYYEIIPMIYFEGKTYEEIAEIFDISARTVMRNRNRLINQLKVVLFSDDVIAELFLE